jgi:hypothetical protein
MSTPVTFEIGQITYTRSWFDWHDVRTFEIISREKNCVTVRDQLGETTRVPVRVTTVHDDIVTEAIDLGKHKYSTTLYATMKTEDIAS